MEDDGGDDSAAHAGQQVLVLGRADRREEARDPPPKGVAAAPAPVDVHFSAVFERSGGEAQLGGGASAGFGSSDCVFGGCHFARGWLKLREKRDGFGRCSVAFILACRSWSFHFAVHLRGIMEEILSCLSCLHTSSSYVVLSLPGQLNKFQLDKWSLNK